MTSGDVDFIQGLSERDRRAPSANPRLPGFSLSPPSASVPTIPALTGLIQQEKRRQDLQLLQSFNQAAAKSADLAGEAQRLSIPAGIPPEIGMENIGEVRALVARRQLRAMQLADRNPTLRAALEDPAFAAIAHDDLPQLGFFENLAANFEVGRLEAVMGTLGEQLRRETRPGEEAILRRKIELLQMRLGELPGSPEDFFFGLPSGFTKLVGQLTVSADEAIAGGAVGAVVPIVGQTIGAIAGFSKSVYEIEAGHSYLSLLDQGVDPEVASDIAWKVGAVNAGLESLGTFLLFGGARALTGPIRKRIANAINQGVARALVKETSPRAIGRLARRWAVGVGGELATETLQEISQIVGELEAGADPGHIGDRIGEILVETFKMSALAGGIAPAIALRQEMANNSVARDHSEFFTRMTDEAATSKTKQRNPDAFESYMQATLQGKPGATVYIEAEKFVEAVEQAQLSRSDLDEVVPGLSGSLEAALKVHGNVEIPTATYVAKINETRLGSALEQHVRLNPNFPSFGEMQSAGFDQETTRMLEQAEQIVEEADQTDREFRDSANRVHDRYLKEQLARIPEQRSKITDAHVRTTAALVRAHVITRAQREGVSPEEWAKNNPLPRMLLSREELQQGVPGEVSLEQALGPAGNVPDEALNVPTAETTPGTLVKSETFPHARGIFVGVTPGGNLWVSWRKNLGAEGQPVDASRPIQSLEDWAEQTNTMARSLQRHWDKRTAKQRLNQPNLVRVVARQSLQQPLATRLPTGVNATENPNLQVLTIDFDIAMSDPDKVAQNAAVMRNMPFLRTTEEMTDEEVIEAFIQHVDDNLTWLLNQMSPEDRARSRLWYDGGHSLLNYWAERYGISPMQAAAVIAILSPRKDWSINLTLAERIMDIVFGKRDFAWDDAMSKTANRRTNKIGKPDHVRPGLLKDAVTGKTLAQVLESGDMMAAAYWVRIYDQTHNEAQLRQPTPEGNDAGQYRSRISWQKYSFIANALSVLVDGSAENVSAKIGVGAKVRSFYNNLFDPSSPDFVTLDSQAVAAGYLLPIAGTDPLVSQVWGRGGGAATDVNTGVNGLYAIMAEAYRRIGERQGLLMREVQSITWEQGRRLFTPAQKRNKAKVEAARMLWDKYGRGEITMAKVRSEMLKLFDGFAPLDWEGVEARPADKIRTYAGESRTEMEQRTLALRTEAPVRVMVEAKPHLHPDLMARWDKLNDQQRAAATNEVLSRVSAMVAQEFGVDVQLTPQRGGWEGSAEASIALTMDRAQNSVAVAARLGELLHQQGMYVMSLDPALGLEAGGAVSITLPEGYTAKQIDELYEKTLWPITVKGKHPVVGHSTQGRTMLIGVDPESAGIDAKGLTSILEKLLPADFLVQDIELNSRQLKHGTDYGTTTTDREAEGRPSRRPPVETRSDRLLRETATVYGEALDRAERLGESLAQPAQQRLPFPFRPGFTRARPGREVELATEVAPVQEGEFHLDMPLGSKLNTPYQVATALAPMATKAQERLYGVVTDEEGIPLAIVGSFKGDVAEAPAYYSILVSEAFAIKEARNLWIVHNHPSASAELSDADRRVALVAERAMRGSRIRPRGVMAIGSMPAQEGAKGSWQHQVVNEDATIQGVSEAAVTDSRAFLRSTMGDTKMGRVQYRPALLKKRSFPVPILEREIVRVSPSKRVAIVRGVLGMPPRNSSTMVQQARDIGGGGPGIMIYSSQGHPIGWIPIDNEVRTLRESGALDELYRALGSTTAFTTAIFIDDDTRMDTLRNYVGAIHTLLTNRVKPGVQRVFEIDTGGEVSASRFLPQGTDPAAFEQPGEGLRSARGEFFPREVAIVLNEEADFSTIMHEMSHWFFSITEEMALTAPEVGPLTQDQQDFQTFLEWRKIDSIATWRSMSFEERRKHTEAFAFSFEGYLFDGQAPSRPMERLFHRFRVWLINVYKEVRNKLNETFRREFDEDLPALTPEMRGVMDRMLASVEQVKQAQAVRGMAPHFESQEQAGATDAEWAQHQQALEDAEASAVTDLEKRSLRVLELLEGPWRGRVLRERAKAWRDERRRIRAEVEKDIASRRVYRAMAYLRTGVLIDESGAQVEVESQAPRSRSRARRPHKLHTPTVRQILDDAGFDPELVNLQQQLGGMTSPEGLDPDSAAGNLGYASGEQMITEIMAAPTLKEAVQADTDMRMALEFGELNDPVELQEAIARALHNQARAQFIAIELKFLTKSTQPVRIMNGAARAAAVRDLRGRRIEEILPVKFEQGEARAARDAREALRKGDEQAAAAAMRRQLLQHHMAREAIAIRDEIDKAQKLFRRLRQPDKKLAKTRNVDMLGAARAILHAHGLVAAATGEQPHMENIKAYGDDQLLYNELADLVAAGTVNRTHWREMSVEDFRTMTEAVKALWERSRRDNVIMVAGQRMEVAEARDQILRQLEFVPEDGKPLVPVKDSQRIRNRVKALVAKLRHVESVAIQLDGGRPGVIHKFLFAGLRTAFDDYLIERNQIVNEFNDNVRKLNLKGKKVNAEKWFGAEVHLTKRQIVGALLHSGNLSNLKKLLWGMNWVARPENMADAELDASAWWDFLDTMVQRGVLTKEHFDFAQYVWDTYEALWPRMQQTNMEVYNYRAETIPAQGFSMRFGDETVNYRGGYTPAMPDRDHLAVRRDRLLNHEDVDSNTSQGYRDAFGNVTAGRGMMISRIDEYARPLQLDVRLTPRHLDQHLRFLHLQAPGRDIVRLLRDPGIRAALNEKDGTLIEEMWKPWLEDTMQNRMIAKGDDTVIRALLIFLRRNTGLATMFGNVANALQQLTGLASSALFVKGKYLRSAAMEFIAHPRAMPAEIMKQSKFMRLRLDQRIGQIRDDTDVVADPSWIRSISRWTQRHAFFLQSWLQYPVDVITWQGAYDEAIATNPNDHDGAVRAADAAVRRSQASGTAPDISRFERGSAAVRMLTQFSSYWLAMFNALHQRKGQPLKQLNAAAVMIGLLGVTAGAISAALKGEWDDEDEDGALWDDMVSWAFGEALQTSASIAVPIIGQPILGLLSGESRGQLRLGAGFSTLSQGFAVIERLVSAALDPERDVEIKGREVRDLATLFTLITGLPWTLPARPVAFQRDLDLGIAQVSDELGPTFFTGIDTLDYIRGLITGRTAEAGRLR